MGTWLRDGSNRKARYCTAHILHSCSSLSERLQYRIFVKRSGMSKRVRRRLYRTKHDSAGPAQTIDVPARRHCGFTHVTTRIEVCTGKEAGLD